MYQNIFISKKDSTVHLWDDTKGYVKFPYQPYAYRKRKGGMYKSIYGDELEKVYKFSQKDPSLFESDVPAETRVLIDAYEDSDDSSTGHRVVYYDIEVSTEGGFPTVDEADKEITAIALYDAATEQYTAFILDKEQRLQDYKKDNVEVRGFQDEDSLLMHFLTKWEEIQPTIATGWNIDEFDTPYVFNRIKRVLGDREAKRLSPIKICYKNDWSGKIVVAGISFIDYMVLYKKWNIKQEPSYALGAIGKKVVGMEKITYHGSLDDLYKSDLNKYIEYNLNDVKIIVALEKKLQFIEQARAICHKGHVPYDCFTMSSRFIEGAILMYLRRKGQVAKNKPVDGREEYENQMEQGEEGFEGAYVKDPIPGRYDWVFDLDLTSMYPNIIISLNISPETKIAKAENWDIDKYVRGDLETIQVGSATYTKNQFTELLKTSNYSIASNGVMYNKSYQGVIPEILIKWFDERKDLRKLAKKHADAKEWEKYEFYDQRQKVQKVLLNSIYGVLGLPIFRFYDKDNASAVTLTGQDIIKTANKAINQYYKKTLNDTENKDYVIYVDTDSCFASALPIIKHKMPDIDLNDEKQMTEAILTVCSEAQKHVNDTFNVMADRMFNVQNHRFDAKQEVIAKTSFWLAKKRYAQFIINKAGIECDEMEVKGIDVVRTSFPIRFRKFMQKFLDDMLRKLPKDQIDASILEFKDKMSTYPVIEIAKNTSVKFISQDKVNDYNPKSRQPFQMIKGAPAQVKAGCYYNDLLKLWELNKDIPEIFHGQKIKWVYLKQNQYGIECIAMKADGTDPQRIMEFIEQYVDREAMYEQELKSKLIDFYNVLHWDYPNETDVKLGEFFSF
jgi:DNA polymerase elongation subunit (family B)